MDEEKNNIIDLAKACEILSISVATGRNWIKSGLLVPIKEEVDIVFENDYISKINNDIKNNKIDRLNKRRNKRSVTGSFIPKKYILNQHSVQFVKQIIDDVELVLDRELIILLLVEYSLKYYIKSLGLVENEEVILSNFEHKIQSFEIKKMVKDFLINQNVDLSNIEIYISENQEAFNHEVENLTEDVLGLMYMSLMSTSIRKKNGMYYTPTNVVSKIVSKVFDYRKEFKNAVDPCCGTGNFLIELVKSGVAPDNIYGYDIDPISIFISRMNIVIFSEKKDENTIKKIVSNIETRDSFTLIENKEKFDLVIGNPPWGSMFDIETIQYLSNKYTTFSKNGLEAFSLFIELGSYLTADGGIFSYIVPETFYSVKSHEKIRKYIMEKMTLKDTFFWGNVFDGVLAPALSFILEQKKSENFALNSKVTNYEGVEFKILKDRSLSSDNWNIMISDYEKSILDKVDNNEKNTTLLNNAEFALGIVTGDNKNHLKLDMTEQDYSPIVKGSDLYKYRMSEPTHFIKYEPEKYQQVAKNNLYFSEEKLIYRFISDTLVFSYDNKKTLSLNSANVIVPKLDGMDIKYVMAILNSRFAHFYFKLKFNSIKILRNHIESIPIPKTSKEVMDEIILKVDDLLKTSIEIERLYKYNELDEMINKLYDLDQNESKYIIEFNKNNIFL